MCINDIKSGIMITISGPGSCKAKSLLADLEYLVIHGSRMPDVLCHNHHGGIIDKDACMGPETKSRGKDASSLASPFRNHIVPKAALTVTQNTTVVDAIIVSSLVHNAHTWCNMTNGNWEAVSKKLALAYANAVPKRVTGIDDKFL